MKTPDLIIVDDMDNFIQHITSEWSLRNVGRESFITVGPFTEVRMEIHKSIGKNKICLFMELDDKYQVYQQWDYVKQYNKVKGIS